MEKVLFPALILILTASLGSTYGEFNSTDHIELLETPEPTDTLIPLQAFRFTGQSEEKFYDPNETYIQKELEKRNRTLPDDKYIDIIVLEGNELRERDEIELRSTRDQVWLNLTEKGRYLLAYQYTLISSERYTSLNENCVRYYNKTETGLTELKDPNCRIANLKQAASSWKGLLFAGLTALTLTALILLKNRENSETPVDRLERITEEIRERPDIREEVFSRELEEANQALLNDDREKASKILDRIEKQLDSSPTNQKT